MRRAVRVGLVVLGAAMAVYGAASLTGGWLGTPPWWEREVSIEEFVEHRYGVSLASPTYPKTVLVEREGREWISGGVVAAGLALAALGAWPRRRGSGGVVSPPPYSGLRLASKLALISALFAALIAVVLFVIAMLIEWGGHSG